eukprot:TRINITY_DN776_c0_g1_i8.p1 TRINITY_DN776_c0_g1~~TRINITY_DN776_c0_g1_i8.p1  ORF type:complete len:315 (+),score=86.90 TRINITY_DN776_c0_g1_i8:260-1204(+)
MLSSASSTGHSLLHVLQNFMELPSSALSKTPPLSAAPRMTETVPVELPNAGDTGNGRNATMTSSSSARAPTTPIRRETMSEEERRDRLRSWSFTIPTGSIDGHPTPPERTSVPVPKNVLVRPDPMSPTVPFRPAPSSLLSMSMDTADLADTSLKPGPLASSVSVDMAEMSAFHQRQRQAAGLGAGELRVVHQHPQRPPSERTLRFLHNPQIVQPQPIRAETPIPVQRPMSTPIILQLEATAIAALTASKENQEPDPAVNVKAYNKHLKAVGASLQRPSSSPMPGMPAAVSYAYQQPSPMALPPWMREAGLLQSI